MEIKIKEESEKTLELELTRCGSCINLEINGINVMVFGGDEPKEVEYYPEDFKKLGLKLIIKKV